MNMDGDIQVMVSRESAILAYGTSGGRIRGRLLAIAAVVVCIVFGMGVALFLAWPLREPVGLVFMTRWTRAQAQAVLSPEVREALPALWKEALARDTRLPMTFGLLEQEGVRRPFVLVPRWQQSGFTHGQTRQVVGGWALIAEEQPEEAVETRFYPLWTAPSQGIWFRSDVGTSTAMVFRWKEGIWRSGVEMEAGSELRPKQTDLSVVFSKEQAEGLDFLESLSGFPVRPRDIWAPPFIVSLGWGEASGRPSFELAYEDPLPSLNRSAVLGSLGVGESVALELPDGSFVREWRLPTSTVSGEVTSTRYFVSDQLLQFPNQEGVRRPEVIGCDGLHPYTRASGKVTSPYLARYFGTAEARWPAVQIGESDGKLGFCFEP